MSKIITLRKGLDINLQGKAVEKLVKLPLAPEYAVSPLDFEGVTPKLLVKAGDRVKAGTPVVLQQVQRKGWFSPRPSAVRFRRSIAVRSVAFST